MSDELVITPATRIGALLSAYPGLEPVLIDFAPEFARLRNPVLRRTVARVATLAQAARVARVDVRELVVALRLEVGQAIATEEVAGEPAPLDRAKAEPVDDLAAGALPAWAEARRAAPSIDADQILGSGSHPLASVERQARTLGIDEMLSLRSSFVPAPLIDTLRQQGFRVHTRMLGPSEYETLIGRS